MSNHTDDFKKNERGKGWPKEGQWPTESRARLIRMADFGHEALALLRELNDALAIPGWLQPRVDAILDRAEAIPK